MCVLFFFFFSSRRRHTRFDCDWSSDVCSSDLPVIAALARCNRADIERAAWALEPAARKRIHVFIATSDLHLERKLRMSRSHCLKVAMDAVRLARTFTDDVQFSAEDATRSDPEFLWHV